MSNLMDVAAKELVPDIEAVFETDCVDKSISGVFKEVVGEIRNGCWIKDCEKYKSPDIYEQYAKLKSFMR